ncbi:uncharacterized protein LOC124162750 [Ischnura elegans]|uniref:uncharacterized protein LOC124162750 n=1 Tax=Ischnura elegans TaxID=197161 RepID=UPI001ED8AC88|nr:uncharacterized protein LOC124162750 [Ischnura elegans]
MYIFFVLAIITILFLTFINLRTPLPVFSVYRQPDKWYFLKTTLFYLALKLREFYEKVRDDDDDDRRGGKKHQIYIEKMECSKKLVYHPQAIDSVYFMAADKKGNFLASSLGRRYNGIADGFIYLNVPEIGFLESMKLPDTILFQENMEKSMRLFSAEGLRFTPLRPLKKWKISYKGNMRVDGDAENVVHVHLDVIWTSSLPFFDIDMHMDAMLLAKAYAREPWNEDFFETVRNFRMTHYEQHGSIHGTAEVNGEIFQLKMNSLKSRSFGIIRRKHFHRCVTHFMHFQDGTSITMGVQCIPVTFSSKEYGYVTKPNGEIRPITFSSMKLYEHGEGGTPPRDYSFSIIAGGRTYHIKVKTIKCTEYYAGWQWETRFVECMATFSYNGNTGWGGIQWQYRHTGNRPQSISSKDPEWTVETNESRMFPLHKEVDYGPVILPFQVNKI